MAKDLWNLIPPCAINHFSILTFGEDARYRLIKRPPIEEKIMEKVTVLEAMQRMGDNQYTENPFNYPAHKWRGLRLAHKYRRICTD